MECTCQKIYNPAALFAPNLQRSGIKMSDQEALSGSTRSGLAFAEDGSVNGTASEADEDLVAGNDLVSRTQDFS